VPRPRSATAQLAPADTKSDGLAVEAHVLARLLGIKLLTLEGLVLVSPAAVQSAPPSPSSVGARPPGRESQSRSGPARRALAANGHDPEARLAGAARLLHECDDELRSLEVPPRRRRG
jgi:hypothetical protein